MAEVYEIFKSEEPTELRTAIALQMLRAASLINEGIKDIPAKVKTEIFLKKPIFGSADNMNNVVASAADLYSKLSTAEQRSLDTTFRDIIESFWNEIRTLSSEDKTLSDALKILDDYIEFKTKIDTVSPETSAEVDRLANMTDEEFEAEMNKPDEEEEDEEDEEEETEQVDTPITLADFNNLSIAELVEKYGSHDTALCLIDAEGGEEKFTIDDMSLFDADDQELLRQEFGTSSDAPNTEEFNEDYDIPDEKLYPQE